MKFVITADGRVEDDELYEALVRISELVAEGFTSGEFPCPDERRGWWEIDPPDDFDRELVVSALDERLKYCERRVRDAAEPETRARWAVQSDRLRSELVKVRR